MRGIAPPTLLENYAIKCGFVDQAALKLFEQIHMSIPGLVVSYASDAHLTSYLVSNEAMTASKASFVSPVVTTG